MSRPMFLAGLLWLGLPFALAACGSGSGGSVPVPAIRALAYVVTDCHEDETSASVSQRLEILQGDRPALTVMELPTVPFPAVGLCSLFAALRAGGASVFSWAFQRLAVSPDGSGVVFEVTFDFSLLVPLGFRSPLTPEQEGIFFVRTDGSGLRRFGPASREASQRLVYDSSGGLTGAGAAAYAYPFFAFSPNGKAITFMDRGAGPGGDDAPQVVVLDIATGTRTPVTRFPDAAPDPLNLALPATLYPAFADGDTVQFLSRANPADPSGKDPRGLNPEGTARFFTVRTNGKGLTVLPAPVVPSGSQILPVFSITRPVTSNGVASLPVPGCALGATSTRCTPVNPTFYYSPDSAANVNTKFS